VRALLAAGCALALLLVAPGGAAAQGEPPWQAAQRLQERLFSAQSALLLGEPASTRAAGVQRLYRGELARRLRADSPAADRTVRRALFQARRAVRAGDEVALAAARGRLRAALLRGSYDVAIAAVRVGDAARARDWLLLREFHQATRFTRPGRGRHAGRARAGAPGMGAAPGAAGREEGSARRLPGPPHG
jgi:hypothetical protein